MGVGVVLGLWDYHYEKVTSGKGVLSVLGDCPLAGTGIKKGLRATSCNRGRGAYDTTGVSKVRYLGTFHMIEYDTRPCME